MAPIKISFNDRNATPPVYVAGSFTEWQPIEIPATGEPGNYTYEKTFDLTPGTYQFKFRLGPGDWWVCDNETTKARDDAGNENNILVIEPEEVKAAPEPVKPVAEPLKAEAAPAPAPVPVPTPEPTVAPSVAKSEPEVVAPATQQFHNLVTQATPAPQPAKTTEAVEMPKSEPAPVQKEKEVEQIPEAKKTTEAPVEKPVNGTAIPPAATAAKDTESNDTSVSSLAPKEKKTVNSEPKQEKLGWFARIFLCGSSGKVMLAAVVVGVPVLLAYVIQK